jgi:CelD/BcsL family acetyltransferase involved in cellulose biosynthesis
VHGTIDSRLAVEWRALGELSSIAADWRALAARALEPNVFYEPAFALAAAPVFGTHAGAGLVWSNAAPRRLLGLFPGRIARHRYGMKLPLLIGWTHPFAPLGTPLVDRDAAGAVITAWLDFMAGEPGFPDLWLVPFLPREGAFAQALTEALARRHGASCDFGVHRRALLAPEPAERARYLERAIGPKKRKELRRQEKRLREAGAVSRATVREPAAIGVALAEFLALEAAGWKGRAGTAAQAHSPTRAFMEEAVTALAATGQASVTRLAVDGRAIAALVMLISGATTWCWKIAYDEDFARFSPGVLLLSDATRALLDQGACARADSCATADHPMIDHVWRERLLVSDRLVRVGPGATVAFVLARVIEGLRRRALAAAKSARNVVRR